MAGSCETLETNPQNKLTDDFEDINKILAVVVKKRKTIPTQCMEINDKIAAFELQRLENAEVVTEGDIEKEEFRRIVEKFYSEDLKSLSITLDDMHEAQKKLEKLCTRMKDISSYLEKRNQCVK